MDSHSVIPPLDVAAGQREHHAQERQIAPHRRPHIEHSPLLTQVRGPRLPFADQPHVRVGHQRHHQLARGLLPGIEVRLDTSAFVGQAARIYLTMPPATANASDLELSWEAQGRFLSGRVRPGQSTLVFEGPVEQPLTRAVFNFVLLVGERTGTQQNRMEVFYELETLP